MERNERGRFVSPYLEQALEYQDIIIELLIAIGDWVPVRWLPNNELLDKIPENRRHFKEARHKYTRHRYISFIVDRPTPTLRSMSKGRLFLSYFILERYLKSNGKELIYKFPNANYHKIFYNGKFLDNGHPEKIHILLQSKNIRAVKSELILVRHELKEFLDLNNDYLFLHKTTSLLSETKIKIHFLNQFNLSPDPIYKYRQFQAMDYYIWASKTQTRSEEKNENRKARIIRSEEDLTENVGHTMFLFTRSCFEITCEYQNYSGINFYRAIMPFIPPVKDPQIKLM